MGTTHVVFSGEYDLACKEQWREELDGLCCEPHVLIDLSDVTYLDCTCIAELVRMHNRRHAKGFDRETIILRQPIVRRLFDLLDMQNVFCVVDSMVTAVDRQDGAAMVRYAFRGSHGLAAISLPNDGTAQSAEAALAASDSMNHSLFASQ
jgi:anti-anti-sigma factor